MLGKALEGSTRRWWQGRKGELGRENSGECHGKAVAQVAAWLAKQSEQRQVAASVSQEGRREEIKEKKEKGEREEGC
jgi:hypothetical protein